MDYATISKAAAKAGLAPRGGFHPDESDTVPLLDDGRTATTVILLGSIGDSLWPAFQAAPERFLAADPLDTWTRRVVGGLASLLGANPVYPFGGPPHLPFQRWAQHAETLYTSPLGLLIHPEHGLWHAYRAALLFAEVFDVPPRCDQANPCLTCTDRPCLTTCPVAAFNGLSYNVEACVDHIVTEAGRPCMSLGCAARRACPVGSSDVYSPDQAQFHMEAFLRARVRSPN